MAITHYTRSDIERLAERLEQRARSIMLSDMPHLQADMRAAARLLVWVVEKGAPITTVEIDNGIF